MGLPSKHPDASSDADSDAVDGVLNIDSAVTETSEGTKKFCFVSMVSGSLSSLLGNLQQGFYFKDIVDIVSLSFILLVLLERIYAT